MYIYLARASMPTFPRTQVSTNKDAGVRGMCMWLSWDNKRKLFISKDTTKNQAILREIQKHIAAEAPEYTYTSVQLNNGVRSRMHVDGSKLGPSIMIYFGPTCGRIICAI